MLDCGRLSDFAPGAILGVLVLDIPDATGCHGRAENKEGMLGWVPEGVRPWTGLQAAWAGSHGGWNGERLFLQEIRLDSIGGRPSHCSNTASPDEKRYPLVL